MYFDPDFATTFLKRESAFGELPDQARPGIADSLTEQYQRQPWDRIVEIANQNRLDYILQFRSTLYPMDPVYANSVFAVYKVK